MEEKVEAKMQKQVKLGQEVTDGISGFKGIVTAICEYLAGHTSCYVEAKINDKGNVNNEWIDSKRLES